MRAVVHAAFGKIVGQSFARRRGVLLEGLGDEACTRRASTPGEPRQAGRTAPPRWRREPRRGGRRARRRWCPPSSARRRRGGGSSPAPQARSPGHLTRGGGAGTDAGARCGRACRGGRTSQRRRSGRSRGAADAAAGDRGHGQGSPSRAAPPWRSSPARRAPSRTTARPRDGDASLSRDGARGIAAGAARASHDRRSSAGTAPRRRGGPPDAPRPRRPGRSSGGLGRSARRGRRPARTLGARRPRTAEIPDALSESAWKWTGSVRRAITGPLVTRRPA
jgi:hypothetical protein